MKQRGDERTSDLFGGDDARKRIELERKRQRSMEAADRAKKTRAMHYGTDAHKLARTGDPATSFAAAAGADTARLERVVHRVINDFSEHGCIADQVREMLPELSYSSVTARFSALERKGFISCGPDKRRGQSGRQQRVMRSLQCPPR